DLAAPSRVLEQMLPGLRAFAAAILVEGDDVVRELHALGSLQGSVWAGRDHMIGIYFFTVDWKIRRTGAVTRKNVVVVQFQDRIFVQFKSAGATLPDWATS